MNKLTRKIGVLFVCLALVVSGFSGIAVDKADAATKSYAKSLTVKVNGVIKKNNAIADIHIGNKTTPTMYLTSTVDVNGKASKSATAKIVSGSKYIKLAKVSGNKYKITAKAAGKAKVKVTTAAKNKSGKYISKYVYIRVTKPGFKNTTSESKIMTSQVKTFKLSKNASFKSVTAKVTRTDSNPVKGVTITKVSNTEWKFKAANEGRYKITFTATTCHNKATSTATGYVTVYPRTSTFGPVSSDAVEADCSISDITITKADGTDGTSAFFNDELSAIVKANADAFGVDTTITIGATTWDIIFDKNSGKLSYKKNGYEAEPTAEELAAISIAKGDSITHGNYKKFNLGLATLRNGGAYTSAKYTISAKVNGTTCKATNVYYKDGYVYFTVNSGKTNYKAYFNDAAALKVVWVSGTPQKFTNTTLSKAFAIIK